MKPIAGILSGFTSMRRNRALLRQLVRREVEARYRGTAFGFVWSFISPVILLSVYTCIFSVVFNARWGMDNESRGMFALTAFCGMISFNVVAEVWSKAPHLILSNVNLVKRVVFPLELLIPVALGSALVQFVVGLIVWMVGWTVITGSLPPMTVLVLPLVLVPALLYSLGIGWLLAALGVFFRDLGQFVGLAIQVLFFLTPIFFPLDKVPLSLQKWLVLNPLCSVVENVRLALVFGSLPNFSTLAFNSLGALLVALFGSWFFCRTKRAFADVI